MDRKVLVDAFINKALHYINLPVREVNGPNRSPVIDKWNERVGEPHGSAYCAASTWCIWKDVCTDLGLHFPMPPTGASQNFVDSVPRRYIRPDGSLGHRGDGAVLQSNDKIHGHMTSVLEDQVSQPHFKTLEFNTGGPGGEGGHLKTRSTVDHSMEDGFKSFRAFVDVAQWILDVNPQKKV